jgi:hypothetical protein
MTSIDRNSKLYTRNIYSFTPPLTWLLIAYVNWPGTLRSASNWVSVCSTRILTKHLRRHDLVKMLFVSLSISITRCDPLGFAKMPHNVRRFNRKPCVDRKDIFRAVPLITSSKFRDGQIILHLAAWGLLTRLS